MIQVIEKQGKSYTIVINDIICTFKPMNLYKGNSLMPLKPFMRNNKAILYWKISNKQISYNQIKNAILSYNNKIEISKVKRIF